MKVDVTIDRPGSGFAQWTLGTVSRFVDRQRGRVAGLRDLPARTALRATNTAPLRRMLGARYDAALAAHRASLPALAGIDAEVVAGLARNGVFVTSLDALALPGSAEVMHAATIMADGFAAQARKLVAAGSDFNVVPAAAILAAPEVFDWGIQDRLLDIAEAYLGLPVAYDGVSINYTVADGREVSTRKWHRDWEDRKMLKVAIYLNDVDVEGGPFQMIARADNSQDDARGFHYALASDEDLTRLLGEDFAGDVVSCEGAAGTVIFTDTARYFHRGKPAIARDRSAVFYSYFSGSPRHPFFCERSGLSRRDIARLATGLAPRQRRAIQWRRNLPMLWKMVPPARL